ncbi:MATE family efflux transporter [Acinetobacter sp. WZC-1]|uniref:MATE family efflux transporter n=1 Tax=Acinetobacter sp. WZC-1 TaxID=3459034 RepID=UPI00403DBE4E
MVSHHKSSSLSVAWRPDAQAIIWLALPLILTNFAHVALTTIDILFMGALGVKQIAAGGLAIALFNQLRTTGTGLVTSVSNLVAEANARKDQAAIQALLVSGFFWATVAGVVFIVLIALLEQPLIWIGQDPEVAALTVHFLMIIAPGFLPCLWFQTLRHFTVGLKYPGPLLAITLISIGLTLALNYVLVFGKLGLPALGLTGIALTTAIVFFLSFFMFFAVVLLNHKLSAYFKLSELKLDKTAIASVWKLGLPIAGTYASEAGFFSVLTLLIGTLGVNALAAQTIINQIVYIVFMISAGISHSASILISEAYSIQDYRRARRLGYLGVMIGCISMLVMAIPYLTIPEHIISLFISADASSQQSMMSLMVSGLAIAALLQVFDATQNIGNGILRGIGDTVSPFKLSIIGYWLVGLPAAWLLGKVLAFGVYGIWFGLMAGLAFTGGLLLYSFHRRLKTLSAANGSSVVNH